MEDNRIERQYWCEGCLAFRPVSSRENGKPCCPDGHQLDTEQHFDWTFPYAEGKEYRT